MTDSPIKITQSDDGISVCYEFDAHYVSDEDIQRIRGYIGQLETKNAKLLESNKKWMGKAAWFEEKNAKLLELVEDLYFDLLGEMPESMLEGKRSQMRELGIEV